MRACRNSWHPKKKTPNWYLLYILKFCAAIIISAAHSIGTLFIIKKNTQRNYRSNIIYNLTKNRQQQDLIFVDR